METLNANIRSFVESFAKEHNRSDCIMGFADVTALLDLPTDGFPYPSAVSIAVAFEPKSLRGVEDGPTLSYYAEHVQIGEHIQALEKALSEYIRSLGYKAVVFDNDEPVKEAQCYAAIAQHNVTYKKIAAQAGLGWVGKNGLLVTKRFGPAVRVATVFTNAPIESCGEIFRSRCERCVACISACPVGAINGDDSTDDLEREYLVDLDACRAYCRSETKALLDAEEDVCGCCVAACPYSKSYMLRND